MAISPGSATLGELELLPETVAPLPSAWHRLKALLRPNSLLNVVSGVPWSWALLRGDGSPAHYLHRRFRRLDWQQHGMVGHLLMGALFLVGMPIVLVAIVVCTTTHGSRVWQQEGKNPLRQAWEQVVLWLGRGVLPFYYYVFELHRDPSRALEYLYRHETKQSIYPILRQRFSSPETTEGLSDKALFARVCEAHGVPAIPALFVIDHGQITRYDSSQPGLPKCDLFMKPVTGSGGRGAELWRHVGDQRYSNALAGVVTEAQLIEHFTRLSEQRPYVGRAYVTNHPALAEVSSGALCSVRVMTCLNERNRPEVTHAVLRMPRTPGIIVDNFHAGGIAASVDLATGIIGRATDLGKSRHTRWWDAHPTTGAAIVGRRIPMWDQVLAAAVQAHAAFADQIVVGWDVAVLESGPQLIEGNKGPDLDIVQRTGREPIGNSRLGVLIKHHLSRALGESAPTRSLRTPMPIVIQSTLPHSPIVEIDPAADLKDPEVRIRVIDALEGGQVVVLPKLCFELTERERNLILDTHVILPTQKERESRTGRPTLIFDPARGRIEKTKIEPGARRELEAMLGRFSDWAGDVVSTVLPSYSATMARDRATYRPCERSQPQGLHMDSSYGRPTQGRGMLRLFCNINPLGRPRIWQLGEPFEPLVARFLPKVSTVTPRGSSLLHLLGITRGRQTSFDRLMSELRGLVKDNEVYQRDGARAIVEFPSGSSWLAITDLAIHGAVSGQHSLDQTWYLPVEAMRHPERASIRVLERLTGKALQ